MGAGPLLPIRVIHGIIEKTLVPFAKKLKQSKNLDALQQPSSAVDDRIALPLQDNAGENNGSKVEAERAWDGHVATVKVRDTVCILFVPPKLGRP